MIYWRINTSHGLNQLAKIWRIINVSISLLKMRPGWTIFAQQRKSLYWPHTLYCIGLLWTEFWLFTQVMFASKYGWDRAHEPHFSFSSSYAHTDTDEDKGHPHEDTSGVVVGVVVAPVVHDYTCNALQWRHNDQITSLTVVYSIVYFRRRSKKTSKLRVTGLCAENSPGPVNSPHKGPVTWKMFPFDDVIMEYIQTSMIKTLISTLITH